VPPGLLHATPFALLPSLYERAFAVAPSARAWLRAQRAELPAGRGVVLVRGPGLADVGSEVDTLGGTYAHSDVLADGNATAERVLAALDGAWLAHLAAHGHFRADSPLFSSLDLDDGPLTVHDLHRLRRAPYRLILPSCDSGQVAAVGADELLGLAAALLPLGTAALVASVVPVNDRATVEVMLALHGALQAGAGVAQALLAARLAQPDDPVRRATALSYLAIGAG
jgi:CHAT domain-containing protein